MYLYLYTNNPWISSSLKKNVINNPSKKTNSSGAFYGEKSETTLLFWKMTSCEHLPPTVFVIFRSLNKKVDSLPLWFSF
jgi:hypothetical protein